MSQKTRTITITKIERLTVEVKRQIVSIRINEMCDPVPIQCLFLDGKNMGLFGIRDNEYTKPKVQMIRVSFSTGEVVCVYDNTVYATPLEVLSDTRCKIYKRGQWWKPMNTVIAARLYQEFLRGLGIPQKRREQITQTQHSRYSRAFGRFIDYRNMRYPHAARLFWHKGKLYEAGTHPFFNQPLRCITPKQGGIDSFNGGTVHISVDRARDWEVGTVVAEDGVFRIKDDVITNGSTYTVPADFNQRKSYLWSPRMQHLAEFSQVNPDLLRDLILGRYFDEIDTSEKVTALMLEATAEQPFERVEGLGLSNGFIVIPEKRPVRVQWRQWPHLEYCKAIKEKDWPLLLKVAEGKYFESFLRGGYPMEAIRVEKQLNKSPELRKRYDDVRGQCVQAGIWDKDTKVSLSIGSRMIIEGRLAGEPLFLIDSPAYGQALYVFDDEETTRAFALKQVSADSAQEHALARIVHTEGWEDRFATAISRIQMDRESDKA